MAEQVNIKLNYDTAQAEKNAEGFTQATNEGAQAVSGLEGKLDQLTGGAVSGFKSMVGGIKSGIAAMSSLKLAIAATGIGALVVVLGSVASYFSRTEEGAQKLRVITAALGALMGEFLDVVSKLGKALVGAFENPKEALMSLGNLIKENIMNRIEGLIELFPKLAQAVQLLFSGEFSEAGKVAADAVAKAGLGVENFTDKVLEGVEAVKEFAKEVERDVSAAIKLEQALNRVTASQRALDVQRAKSRAQIKELNKIAEDTTKSEEERIAAAEKAIAIETNLMNEQIALAEERLRIKQAQNNLSDSSEADLQAEADLEIQLAGIKQESLELQTTLQNKLNTIREQGRLKREQEIAAEKAYQDAIVAKQLENAEILLKLQQDYQILSAQSAEEAARIRLDNEFKNAQRELEIKGASFEAQEQLLANYELRVTQMTEDNAKAREQIAKSEAAARRTALFGVAAASLELAGELSKNAETQKKIAYAQAIVSAAAGITSAFNPYVPVVSEASAAIVAATTGIQINKIAKTPIPGAGGGGLGAAPSQSFPTGFAAVPQGSNAQFRGVVDDTAIKAYVVANDVSNAQEANSRIKRQATI